MVKDSEPKEYDVSTDPRFLDLERYLGREFDPRDAHYWARELTTFLGEGRNWIVGLDGKGGEEKLRLDISQDPLISLTLIGRTMAVASGAMSWHGNLVQCVPYRSEKADMSFLLRDHDGELIYLIKAGESIRVVITRKF